MNWDEVLEDDATTLPPTADSQPHITVGPGYRPSGVIVAVDFVGDLVTIAFVNWKLTPLGWVPFDTFEVNAPQQGSSSVGLLARDLTASGRYYFQITGLTYGTEPPEPGSYRLWIERATYLD